MKKRYKVFKWSFILLFVIFMTLYFSQLTGYYEYQNYQKMVMTEEQIIQFENDIKAGLEVDIKNYTVNTVRKYDNSFSNVGAKVSNFVSGLVEGTVVKIFTVVSDYVAE